MTHFVVSNKEKLDITLRDLCSSPVSNVNVSCEGSYLVQDQTEQLHKLLNFTSSPLYSTLTVRLSALIPDWDVLVTHAFMTFRDNF